MNIPIEFLAFRKIGILTPAVQLIAVVLLYTVTTLFAFADYNAHGTMFGYPFSISILFIPIYEEIIFRGFILEYAQRHLSWTNAIALTSALFSLWHLKNIFFLPVGGLIYQMLYAGLIVSPLLSYITLRTRTIWPNVILHYLNNVLSPVSWMVVGALLRAYLSV